MCQAQNHFSKMRLQLLTASVIYIFAGPKQFYHIFSNTLKIQRLHELLWLQNHSQAEMETKSIPQSSGHTLGIPFLNLINSFLNPWILLISTASHCKDNDYNASAFTDWDFAGIFVFHWPCSLSTKSVCKTLCFERISLYNIPSAIFILFFNTKINI